MKAHSEYCTEWLESYRVAAPGKAGTAPASEESEGGTVAPDGEPAPAPKNPL